MINVDISNIWGELSLQDLLGIEQEIFAAHAALGEETRKAVSPEAHLRIRQAAESIRADSEICVVIGSGAGCLGARAAIELLQGPDRNLGTGRGNPRILFAGSSLSTRQWNDLKGKLEGKDLSVIVFGEAGAEEAVPALRGLKWMLERRLGTDECSRRVHTAASPKESALLTMAAAGIDIAEFLMAEEEARRAYDLRSFENPVWLYTAVRSLMCRSGKTVELLSFWEPDCAALGKWWQHLFLAAEGGGVFSLGMEFPEDLSSLDRKLQQEQKTFFETLVRFAPNAGPWDMASGVSGMDGLDDMEEQAYLEALEAHADRGVPIITMDCGAPDAGTLGWLAAFLELSCAVSGQVRTAAEAGE